MTKIAVVVHSDNGAVADKFHQIYVWQRVVVDCLM